MYKIGLFDPGNEVDVRLSQVSLLLKSYNKSQRLLQLKIDMQTFLTKTPTQ